MERLRIAIIGEVYTAGATRCARDLERHLSERHDVRYYPREGPETVEGLLEDLRSFAPDVVHLHSFFGDLPYDFLATVSHLYPTCYTPHDPRPIGTWMLPCWDCAHAKTCFNCPMVRIRYRYTGVLNPFFRQRSGKRLTHARSSPTLNIITPSKWLQQRLAASELSRFTMHHVPYGIDLHRFHPIPDARARLGLPEDSEILLHVAHTTKGWWTNDRKGMKFLADAFVDHVVPSFPDALLIVAGEGMVPNHPNVRPAGFVGQEDIALYYSAADVFCAPTLADNLPYTVLEAMGCGAAVVGSRVGGVPEEIDEGVTGYLAAPGDSHELGLALVKILGDRPKLREMRRAGRCRAERLFNMETFIEKHEAIYRGMAGAGKAA